MRREALIGVMPFVMFAIVGAVVAGCGTQRSTRESAAALREPKVVHSAVRVHADKNHLTKRERRFIACLHRKGIAVSFLPAGATRGPHPLRYSFVASPRSEDPTSPSVEVVRRCAT